MNIHDVRILGQQLPMTLVEVHGDSGVIGIGGCEAPAIAVRAIIDNPPWCLREILVGQEAAEIGVLWRKMLRAIWLQGGIALHAGAALDMALWDLLGKTQQQPLYEIFGGAAQPKIMAYASATAFDLTNLAHYQPGSDPPMKSNSRLAEEAQECVSLGFRAVKFGFGDHFALGDEEARVAAIRDAIGPNIRFMVDFGGPAYFEPGVTPKTAAKIARMLEAYDVYFLEEPLPPHDWRGHAQLTEEARIFIASGEMLCHLHEFEQFIQTHAVDVIQPDAYRIGVSQMLRVAQLSNDAGILCVPHSPWSALALAAHVNVLATVPNGIMVEYPAPSLFRETKRHGEVTRINHEGIVSHPLEQRDGYISLPQRPGLGIGDFNPEAVAKIDDLAAKGLER
jgi:L-alanine-DL-glutamate epimerase-like enolase superfamily enzyme